MAITQVNKNTLFGIAKRHYHNNGDINDKKGGFRERLCSMVCVNVSKPFKRLGALKQHQRSIKKFGSKVLQGVH